SLGFDRAGDPKIFFAESSFRATLYATRDFAGGEALRAVRYAVTDLERYLNDSDIRRRHEEQQRRSGVQEWTQPDLSWIKQEMNALSHIAEKCRRAELQHSHGVVYAVRFVPDDHVILKYNSAMGLISLGPMAPDRLIAKIRVPAEVEHEPRGDKR